MKKMRKLNLHIALADTIPEIPPLKKDRRLGKKLYLTLAVIVALVTVTVAFVVTQTPSSATGAETQWSKTYYGDVGRAIQTSDGGYAIAGNNASVGFFPAVERAPTLMKTDSSGNLMWNKTFPATGHVGTAAIVQTKDGGYVLSGTNIAAPITSPVYSGWLIKTDATGNVDWTKTFVLPLQTCYTIEDSRGDFVVTGYAENDHDSVDAVLMKVNVHGDLVWTKTFGGNSSKLLALNLVEADEGGYVVEGCVIEANYNQGGWLLKTDWDGNVQWSEIYQTDENKNLPFNSMAKTSDGGYIVTASSFVQSWLVKIDSSGATQWIKTFEINGMLRSVVEAPDGGYVAVGVQDRQACVVRTDSSGALLRTELFGEVSDNVSSSVSSVIVTRDGNFVVGGTLNHYSPTTVEGFKVTPEVGEHVWLTKMPLSSMQESTASG
ncbi:MAG: hypothetical protein ACQCN6_11235 [Candidatus Bathyarchaeia archaeon]